MFGGLPSAARSRHPSRLLLDDADPINRGLVGWWPLDEGGGTLVDDISPWRGRGTLTNGPTRIVGARGRAVNFDGSNDYIAMPGRQDITAFSAVAWLYLSAGATFSHSILSSLFGLDQTILWTTDTYGTQFKFWATTSASNATSSTIPHIRERWVCAGVSWAPGRTTRFYLDGVPIGSGTTAGDLRSPVTGWNIGRYGVPAVWYFPGAMRGVRAWRRVLADREFARLSADEHAGAESPEDRIFVALGRTGPTIYALTADDLGTGAPGVGTPALGQVQALLADGIGADAPGVGAPTLGQIQALLASSIGAGVPGVGAPVLTQVQALIADDLGAGAPGVGSPALNPSAVVPPASRTLVLPARSRGATLAARDRALSLPARSRTVTLAPERT